MIRLISKNTLKLYANPFARFKIPNQKNMSPVCLAFEQRALQQVFGHYDRMQQSTGIMLFHIKFIKMIEKVEVIIREG